MNLGLPVPASLVWVQSRDVLDKTLTGWGVENVWRPEDVVGCVVTLSEWLKLGRFAEGS